MALKEVKDTLYKSQNSSTIILVAFLIEGFFINLKGYGTLLIPL